jgi:hypothetical protein
MGVARHRSEGNAMNRIHIVLTIGLCVAAAGLILALQADSLATNWQRTTTGDGWGGVSDPALRQTYYTVGRLGLCFGLALIALAASRWLAAVPQAPRRTVAE